MDEAQNRFQPAAMAQLRAADVPKLKLKWAFGFAYATQAYAQPAVVGGRIFVGSAGPKVFSLDAKSGCTYWVSETDGPVRTAISVGAGGTAGPRILGISTATSMRSTPQTARRLWKIGLDEHPSAHITGAPTLVGDRLYVTVSSLEEVSGSGCEGSVLQIPGQCFGARCRNRQSDLEELHDSGRAQASSQKFAGCTTLGTVRRGHLVFTGCGR